MLLQQYINNLADANECCFLLNSLVQRLLHERGDLQGRAHDDHGTDGLQDLLRLDALLVEAQKLHRLGVRSQSTVESKGSLDVLAAVGELISTRNLGNEELLTLLKTGGDRRVLERAVDELGDLSSLLLLLLLLDALLDLGETLVLSTQVLAELGRVSALVIEVGKVRNDAGGNRARSYPSCGGHIVIFHCV